MERLSHGKRAGLGLVLLLGACGLRVQGTAPAADSTDGGEPDPSDGGAQITECEADETRCGDTCVVLARSTNHCGACGAPCGAGLVCEDSKCVPLCETDMLRCEGACVDPKTDPKHCGDCGKPCGSGLLCSAGSCVVDCGAGLTRCTIGSGDVCVDTQTDRDHCGGCGTPCSTSQRCVAGTCTSVCAGSSTVGDAFSPDMVGCAARVSYSQRATLCPPGSRVCSASEWIARRAGKKPTYNYWTNDNLRYAGSSSSCRAVTNGGFSCGGDPMRVCGAREDPLGNDCNWIQCGYQSTQPNEWFGGCQDNRTAGTLCCR